MTRFGDPDNWAEHRWTRFRTSMELTEDCIRRIADVYPMAIPPDPLLQEILLRPQGAPPTGHCSWSDAEQQQARRAMDELVALWTSWRSNGAAFHDEPPRPSPDLRVRPRI